MTILTTAIKKLSPVFAEVAKKSVIKAGKIVAGHVLGEIIESLGVMVLKRDELKKGGPGAQAFNSMARRAFETHNDKLKEYLEKISGMPLSQPQSQHKVTGLNR